jgi:hypothetical protein
MTDLASERARRMRRTTRASRRLRQGRFHDVPSPLVGEGQGGGDSTTSEVVNRPSPFPQGGGDSGLRLPHASQPTSSEQDNA